MVQDRCKSNTPKMSGVSSLTLRASIVLGMVAAVVTVIYFTPLPGKRKVFLICITINRLLYVMYVRITIIRSYSVIVHLIHL